METVLQGLIGLSSMFLIGLGAKTMLAPRSMVDLLAIEPAGPAGLSTMRGFLGGLFIGSAVLLATGLATGMTVLFLAVATNMSLVVFGRLLGIVADGFDKRVLAPLIAEILMVSIFITAHAQMGAS